MQRDKLKERRNNCKIGSPEWNEFFIVEEKNRKVKANTVLKPQIVMAGQVPRKPGEKIARKMVRENLKNEQHDVSSESEQSTSESDIDHGPMDEDAEVEYRELDNAPNEKVKFSDDVYNYTICANMTRCLTPLQLGFALKQCFIVFSV